MSPKNRTRDLGRERRAVYMLVLEANVDVVLSGRYGHVDVGHDSVFLFLLDDVSLGGTVNLYVDVF